MQRLFFRLCIQLVAPLGRPHAVASLCAILLAGCGQQYWTNGVRPIPRGEARVVLVGQAGAWIPVACYDPDWVRLAGPADCADLIPSGTQVLDSTGKTRTLTHRRPAVCDGAPAVGFPDAQATGLAVWPAVIPRTWPAIDLDADGVDERIEAGPGAVEVWQGTKMIGRCGQGR